MERQLLQLTIDMAQAPVFIKKVSERNVLDKQAIP